MLFIDASKELKPGKNQNTLEDERVQKIVDRVPNVGVNAPARPPVALLDEAMPALDRATERNLLAALNELDRVITTTIVQHS